MTDFADQVLAQERRIRLALGDGEEINSVAAPGSASSRPGSKKSGPGKGGSRR
jgi:hypothetical protein